MKNKALHQDFFREIKGSLNRFLSILFIVAMGVAFFSGIRASEPDMRLTADAYFDRQNTMDLRVVGTLGLTDEDVKALSAVDGVKAVEPSYMTDVKSVIDGNEKVLHLEALTNLNAVVLQNGRLPSAPDECLLEASAMEGYGLSIGDRLPLRTGTEDDMSQTLASDELTIVGSCASPLYISFDKGTASIGSGKVDLVAFVPQNAFTMEAYPQIWITADGAIEQTAYTDDYISLIAAVQQQVEAIADVRCQARYEEVTAEAHQELSDAENELEQARQEANEELDRARRQLESGQVALESGKRELAKQNAQLKQAAGKLASSRFQLDQGWGSWRNGAAKLEQGRAEYESRRNELLTGLGQLEQGRNALRQSEQALDANRLKLQEGQRQWEAGQKEYEESLGRLEAAEAELEQSKQTLHQLNQLINAGMANEAQIAAAAALQNAIEQTIPVLEAARQELAQAEATLNQTRKELDDGQKVLDEGLQNILQQKSVLDATEQTLQEGILQLSEAKNVLDQNSSELNTAKAELDIGESEYAKALLQLEQGQQQWAMGQAALKEKESELNDGWLQYEQSRLEAENELSEAAVELADARASLSEITLPDWYVTDRDNMANYAGYGENADRMRAIGRVFPVLFFLVAALVSLTTMTRMVEEERTQIGTMKALGYGKGAIAMKYIGYALLATLCGSLLGLLAGQKLFPFVIIRAYGILYPNMDTLVIPYHPGYSIMATAAALACTLTATWFSCYRALAGQPAELMRPEPPKSGKRVLLERITPLWKRLSFTWKSTVRNLFRYKKRFFMTVLGIGGCMALMLVGFGLKDSIMDIVRLQYQRIQLYDATVIVSDKATAQENERMSQYLQEQRELDGYLRTSNKLVTAQHDEKEWDVYLTIPESTQALDQFLQFYKRGTDDSYTLGDEGAILTEKAAKQLGVSAGDSLVLQLDAKRIEVPVSAVCENYLQHYIYLSPALYERLSGNSPDYNAIIFRMAQGQEDALESICEVLLADHPVLAVNYSRNLQQQLNDMLQSLDAVILVLILSAGLLAFVVLYNLNNINITERRRELATLKVLGFYDVEVSTYVFRENILLTLIGALAGCGFGIILHRFIIETVEIEMCMFGRTINFPSFVYSIVCTLAFSLLVNLVMHRKLKKIDMVESLKSVE